ncbi:MAG: hypothetical protein IKX00_02265 [Bacilli bacterium]|nr:hypothetical protein [Bacilli bacterium]
MKLFTSYTFLLKNMVDDLNKKFDDASEIFDQFNDGGFVSVLFILLVLFIVQIIIVTIFNYSKRREISLEKKLRTKNTSSEIPCKGDLYITYFIASKCNLADYLSLKGNLISSFYLKWLKKGLLKIDKSDAKDKQAILYFDDKAANCIDDEVEAELYTITKNVLDASGANYFKADDLVSYMTNNNEDVINFFEHAYYKGKKRVYAAITPVSEKVTRVDNRILTEYMLELKKQIVEFINFINKVDILDNYEFESVKVWDNYYIFANLLGLRDKIKDGRFKDKVNPNLIKLKYTRTFENIDNIVHVNVLCSEKEYKNNKRKIIKSKRNYEKETNNN